MTATPPDGDASTPDRETTTAPDTDPRFDVPLRGVSVDPETRCAHWDAPVDVVALRFGCCETYYPCDACHDAATDHEAVPWPRGRFDEPAVLCGACGTTLTAREYLAADDDACPACGAAFNPGCRKHRDRYFEIEGTVDGDGEDDL
ncbi:CHY zinc finger protein [Halorubrum distributum]|uniref:CHY zinc finger protein n=1 Tax=Halorubrum distributum TaxID=29283 RepID=UPI0029538E3B|nr:CHY zinc finger protein [Halorubrum distributum]MDV7348763.1 CHY zinc finger protein [Halorubrum distributum]